MDDLESSKPKKKHFIFFLDLVSKLRGAHKKVANLFLTGKGRNSCSMERKEHSNKKNFQRCFNFRKKVKKFFRDF